MIGYLAIFAALLVFFGGLIVGWDGPTVVTYRCLLGGLALLAAGFLANGYPWGFKRTAAE